MDRASWQNLVDRWGAGELGMQSTCQSLASRIELTKHIGFLNRVDAAATVEAVSSGSEGTRSSTRHFPLNARKMHFTTGAAAVAP